MPARIIGTAPAAGGTAVTLQLIGDLEDRYGWEDGDAWDAALISAVVTAFDDRIVDGVDGVSFISDSWGGSLLPVEGEDDTASDTDEETFLVRHTDPAVADVLASLVVPRLSFAVDGDVFHSFADASDAAAERVAAGATVTIVPLPVGGSQ